MNAASGAALVCGITSESPTIRAQPCPSLPTTRRSWTARRSAGRFPDYFRIADQTHSAAGTAGCDASAVRPKYGDQGRFAHLLTSYRLQQLQEQSPNLSAGQNALVTAASANTTEQY